MQINFSKSFSASRNNGIKIFPNILIMTDQVHRFEQKIGYCFNDKNLLELALKHSSCDDFGQGDNQRLEFLGDAVLDLVIADTLYRSNPDFNEGKLNNLRANIVKGAVLAKHARTLGVDQVLQVSEAQRRHQPKPSAAMLEDALEALIGAVYLDGGIETARAFILKNFDDIIRSALENDSSGNPKGCLQEWMQHNHEGAIPQYVTISEEGPQHARMFESVVQFDGCELGRGKGRSKKSAEIAAAEQALHKLSC